jgi:hypothetical protein
VTLADLGKGFIGFVFALSLMGFHFVARCQVPPPQGHGP